MGNDAKHDNELAALTDSLLEGRDQPVSEDVQELSQVVRQLHQVIRPDVPPDPLFRKQLARRLNQEWTYQRRAPRWYANRYVRLAALAAVLMVVLLGVALLSAQSNSDNTIEGTAIGTVAWTAAIVVVVAGALVGLALWWQQRRR
jgi:type VI protein secretion system component VasF